MAAGTVIPYSLAKDGDKRVGPHFKVREFACHDGADLVKVSPETVDLLEKVRDYYANRYGTVSVVIVSGYRTPSWNRKVGGARYSQHLQGRAADFVVRIPEGGVVPPHVVYGDLANGRIFGPHAGGLGEYRTFTHIDTRGRTARWSG